MATTASTATVGQIVITCKTCETEIVEDTHKGTPVWRCDCGIKLRGLGT